MICRDIENISQKLECLDIAHASIHHEFHISAEFYDIEIFGHLPNHRDIEQETKPLFFTNFSRKEYPTYQSKSYNGSKDYFPFGLQKDRNTLQCSSNPW